MQSLLQLEMKWMEKNNMNSNDVRKFITDGAEFIKKLEAEFPVGDDDRETIKRVVFDFSSGQALVLAALDVLRPDVGVEAVVREENTKTLRELGFSEEMIADTFNDAEKSDILGTQKKKSDTELN